jgi:hypothetical protein
MAWMSQVADVMLGVAGKRWNANSCEIRGSLRMTLGYRARCNAR